MIFLWIISAFVLGLLINRWTFRTTTSQDTIARLTSGGTPPGKSRCRCEDAQDQAYCDFYHSDRCDGEFIDD